MAGHALRSGQTAQVKLPHAHSEQQSLVSLTTLPVNGASVVSAADS